MPARRRSKYRNVKTEVDGIRFDSKREAARYLDLLRLLTAGTISNLRRQVSHQITVNGIKIARYVSDFEYDLEDGTHVIEDVKSAYTAKDRVYRLKKKLVKACLGIDIREEIS